MILGKSGTNNNGTGNNGTNRKVGKNGTLMLIFRKTRPQTCNSHSKLPHPNPQTSNLNIKNMPFLPVPFFPVSFLPDTI